MQRIRVPYELYPSALLWLDNLSQTGRDLKSKCRDAQNWDTALLRQLSDDARGLLARGDANSCATVLICLADRCREGDELILAREWCEEAETLFCCYEDSRHVHNRAVALYALGLIHQSLRLEREAVSSYGQALEAFRRARAEWMTVRDCAQRRMGQCRGVERWIRRLRAGLASAESVPTPQGSTLVSFPVLSATSAGDPLCAKEEFEEWVEVEESVAGRANFALRVKGDSMIGAGIDDGDLVLMQGANTWPGDGQIVVVRIDGLESGSVLKRFYRQKGHICLQPANDAYPFLVVLPAWRLKEETHRRYGQSHPQVQLEYYLESAVQCVGWYHGKV